MDAVDQAYNVWQELEGINTSNMSQGEKAEHEEKIRLAIENYNTQWALDKRNSRTGSVYY